MEGNRSWKNVAGESDVRALKGIFEGAGMCGVMLRSIETVILHLQVLVVKDVWEESSPLEKV